MSLIVAEVEKIKDGCETAINKCGCCVLRGVRLRNDFDGCGVGGAGEGKKDLLYNFLGQLSPLGALKDSHVYKPYRKFVKLRSSPVGMKNN